MSDPVIECSNLRKEYGTFKAVDGISFAVSQGEIFGFLGPNGAGKSTTMKLLTGIQRPSGGSARVAGFDVVSQAVHVRSNIGYMSQKFSLYMDLTVQENLTFFAGIYLAEQRVNVASRIASVIAQMELEGQRDVMTESLPAGWRQKLALGCAIVHQPRVLFLDEPTAGVDPESRRKFWELIFTFSRSGVTVFVSTHYMDEAERCDRLAFILAGKLVAMGSPAALKRESMRAGLLSLHTPQAMGSMETLRGLPGIEEISLHGNALHITTSEDVTAVQQRIVEALTKRGIPIQSIGPTSPSLEDVFLSLVDREKRENGGAPGT